MSTSERLAKRAREEDVSPSEIVRSADHWLEDGSIVLQVESTQFRVTKSTLAKYSTVFQDMLSLPLPPDEPLVEGCPLVIISGDSPSDWKHLLDTMQPNCKRFFMAEYPPLEQVRSVLRLSKKYEMVLLRQSAVDLLRSEYPTGLEDYHERMSKEVCRYDPASVVSVARETGVPSVLPGAFYLLSIYASVQMYDDEANDPDVPSDLSPEDQALCAKGQNRLFHFSLQRTLQWFASESGRIPGSSCPTKSACRLVASRRLKSRLETMASMTAASASWDESIALGFCQNCTAEYKSCFTDARKEVWEKMPSYFGLPPWEELLRMDLE
ncbi:BTB domain-containing protein [Mycena kentingensis (nom. inval.)]|nr:BTB domain-containing protein [Mycena kentingensis (nom. inval.)]